jgi:hypothetical protein
MAKFPVVDTTSEVGLGNVIIKILPAMRTALDTFGNEPLSWAKRIGMSPELLHRVASRARACWTLLLNGTVSTFLGMADLPQRQSNRDIFAINALRREASLWLSGCGASFNFV